MTNGHLDVIARAALLLDKLIVGVADQHRQGTNVQPAGAEECPGGDRLIANKNEMSIEVMPFEGLLTDFARAGA